MRSDDTGNQKPGAEQAAEAAAEVEGREGLSSVDVRGLGTGGASSPTAAGRWADVVIIMGAGDWPTG